MSSLDSPPEDEFRADEDESLADTEADLTELQEADEVEEPPPPDSGDEE